LAAAAILAGQQIGVCDAMLAQPWMDDGASGRAGGRVGGVDARRRSGSLSMAKPTFPEETMHLTKLPFTHT
jgi:hypothetical protein